MISALQYSSIARDTCHLDLILRSLKVDFSLLVHTPNPQVNGTSDESFSLLSRSYSAINVDRVATADCHDTGAWFQDWNVHDTELDAVATPSSLSSNGAAPSYYFSVDVARSRPTLMNPRAQGSHDVDQFHSATRPGITTLRPHDWTSLGLSDSSIPAAQHNDTVPPYLDEDLSEGQRRVGEILVRCGVINASGTSRIESTSIGCGDTHPINTHVASDTAAKMHIGENDGVLVTALSDWTSQWVHKLIVQPYLRGSFHFKYQGKPGDVTASVSSRIRRVLSNVHNPVQVAVHALWLISTLTGNGAQDNAPFLSISVFRYLHNNGTFVAEDFMFRSFVICAMISDKTINDAPLSTSAWSRLTRISLAILNATERYALSWLKWNTVMTSTQWQDIVIFLRSCIKMSSVFDPFAYDEASSSGVMARCLDKLVDLSYKAEATPQQAASMEIFAPQPVLHFTHWEVVFDAMEWCPKDDPVINQRPRTIGVAPGADQSQRTREVGTTAEDLLHSILGSDPDQAIRGWWSFWQQPSLVYDFVT